MTTVNLQHYPHPVSVSVLDNKLTVITMTTPSDLAHMRFAQRIGSMQDGEDKGIVHLYEHLSSSGKNREATRPALARLALVGVESSMSTGINQMNFDAWGLRKHAKKIIAALGEIVFSFDTTQKSLEREKPIILQEMRDRLFTTLYQEWRYKLMYPDRPEVYSPIIGYPETLASITLEKIYKFHERFFIPDNVAVFVVGNINHAEVVETASKLKIDNRQGCAVPRVDALEAVYASGTYECYDNPSLIWLYLPQPTDKEEAACLDLAADMLAGSGMYSILTNRLRIKKTAVYYTDAQSGDWPLMLFAIEAGANPESFQLVEDAIVREIEKLGKGKLPKTVFAINQSAILTRYQTRRHELAGGDWIEMLSADWRSGDILDDLDWQLFWENIAPEKVAAAVKNHWLNRPYGVIRIVNKG